MTLPAALLFTPTRGPSRFRLAIKPRFSPPSPYAWEIYDDEHDELVQQSKQRFRTFKDAWAVGSIALEKMLARDGMATSSKPVALS